LTDYLRHLAAKNLNLEKGVAPRLPAFFEPVAYTGSAFCAGIHLAHDPIPDEREERGTEPRTSSQDTSSSYQSPISSQSEGARTSGSLTPIPAKPGIGFTETTPSPRSSGIRSSRYISKDRGNRVFGQNRPKKIDLRTNGITGRDPSLHPIQCECPIRFEPEPKKRKAGLDYKQVPLAAHVHTDMAEKERELRRRMRRGVTHPRQMLQNSLQIPEHIKERPTQARAGERPTQARAGERPTQARAGRCNGPLSTRSDVPKYNLYQLEMHEKEHKTLSSKRDFIPSKNQPERKNRDRIKDPGDASKRKKSRIALANEADLLENKNSSKGDIPDLSFGSGKTNDIDQIISEILVTTGSAAAKIHPNIGIKHSEAITPMEPLPDRSPPFFELSSQIADIVNDRKPGSFLVKAIGIGSMPDGRSVGGDLEVRKKADAYQEAGRSFEKAISAPRERNGKSAIQVTIGRIEVRAERPNRAPSAPPLCKPAAVSRLSLDEYLKQRSTGQI